MRNVIEEFSRELFQVEFERGRRIVLATEEWRDLWPRFLVDVEGGKSFSLEKKEDETVFIVFIAEGHLS